MQMRVVLSAIGKFHTFDLARQLERAGMFEAIFTGFPMFKLGGEGLPAGKIRTFPWLQTPFIVAARYGLVSGWLGREYAYISQTSLGRYVARRMPACDAYVGLSGSGLEGGRVAHRRGALYICDRGSTHIAYQDRVLAEEYRRMGINRSPVDPRMIAREEAEYREADLVTVPSRHTLRSFVEMGVPESKLRRVPYGVDLSRFQKCGDPDPERFDILFVGSASIRKGISYLLDAYARLRHPKKSLRFVGTIQTEVRDLIDKAVAADSSIVCAGHCPQPQLKEIMSRSHVLILASLEEGLALVQAQAMACGCPVVATRPTGAEDLFDDGEAGYIVETRDTEALADRLQTLADHPGIRTAMSAAAIEAVKRINGWDTYGEAYAAILRGGACPL